MGLSNSRLVESFDFQTLGDLRKWLNMFGSPAKVSNPGSVDLATVYPEGSGGFRLDWYEESMGDGSKVYNARLTTPDITEEELVRRLNTL